MRFRAPELFLGAFLAVAVFAMGMLFTSSYQPSPAQLSKTEARKLKFLNPSRPTAQTVDRAARSSKKAKANFIPPNSRTGC
jgi:hypothetical protein